MSIIIPEKIDQDVLDAEHINVKCSDHPTSGVTILWIAEKCTLTFVCHHCYKRLMDFRTRPMDYEQH